MNIHELRQKHAKLVSDAAAIYRTAEQEKRDVTGEERERFDNLLAAADEMQGDIVRAEKLEERMKGLEESVTEPIKPDPQDRGGAPATKEERGFDNFGEQLIAVYRFAQTGNRDPRLSRAISGMSETVPSDGGVFVQKDFSQELIKRMYDFGQVSTRCRKIGIGANSNGLKLNGVDETSRANGSRWGGIQTYWVNEGGELTSSKPKFRQMELDLKKLTGLYYATEELLQDASALAGVAMQGFTEEFAFKLDDAIIRGNGAGQPKGILNSAALIEVTKETGQLADTVVYENIVKMWSRMLARNRSNAVWYINQDVEPSLYTMSMAIGTGGVPVYLPAGGASSAPYGTLFGRPVIPIEQASTVGDAGDVLLADMSQYLLIDKGDIRTAMSVHVMFTTDQTVYRMVYRVDGQPVWNNQLTPAQGSTTLSPFVTIEDRT